jgi:hypothetical protein
MKRLAVAILLLVMLAACGKSQPAADSPEVAVRESFRGLKSAFRNGLGQEASKHVTTGTLDMYERCRKLALDSSGTNLESLPQIEVLLVLQLRWLLSKAELEKMDGAGVFAWGVERGLAKKETLESMELDKIQVTGRWATASVRSQDQPVSGQSLAFELQDGVWGLDFVQVLALTEPLFARLRAESRKNKADQAAAILQTSYKMDIPPGIFTGPLK